MESNKTKNLEYLKSLTDLYFSTLQPANDNHDTYTAKIKVLNYFELGCLITDILKLCIHALDHDMHNVEKKKKQSINIGLILEMVLSIFPLDEMEFLGYVGEAVE